MHYMILLHSTYLGSITSCISLKSDTYQIVKVYTGTYIQVYTQVQPLFANIITQLTIVNKLSH